MMLANFTIKLIHLGLQEIRETLYESLGQENEQGIITIQSVRVKNDMPLSKALIAPVERNRGVFICICLFILFDWK